MAPLRGLTSLYAPGPAGPGKADGRLASQGGPVGPGFGYADPEVPYAYWAGPTPNEQTMFTDGLDGYPGGIAPVEGTDALLDRTPAEVPSHAAPYPPQGTYGQLRDAGEQLAEQEERRALHGADLGGPARVATDPNGNIYPEPWHEEYYTGQGESLLVEVPGQIESSPLGGSGTGKNRIGSVQGFGELGHNGSGTAHIRRRTAVGPVPGNNQWLNSSDRPMLTPRRGYQTSFDGPDSPYGAQGDTSQDMMQSAQVASVSTPPTPYNPPPNPLTAAPDPTLLAGPMISDFF